MASKLPLGSNQNAIVAISIVAAIVPAILVVLRMVARRIANRPLNSSDYLIIPACVSANRVLLSQCVSKEVTKFILGRYVPLYINGFLLHVRYTSQTPCRLPCLIIAAVYEVGLGFHITDVMTVMGTQVVVDFLKVFTSPVLFVT